MADSENPEIQTLIMAQMEHVLRLFQQMNKTHKPELEPELEHSIPDLKVSEKLTYHNYTKWCKLMHIALDSRGWLKHIIAAPPTPADPNYRQWRQRHPIVLSWIITNIDSDLVNQFLDYNTA